MNELIREMETKTEVDIVQDFTTPLPIIIMAAEQVVLVQDDGGVRIGAGSQAAERVSISTCATLACAKNLERLGAAFTERKFLQAKNKQQKAARTQQCLTASGTRGTFFYRNAYLFAFAPSSFSVVSSRIKRFAIGPKPWNHRS